jgi:raffinose/stachyose/melibiose transport system substrate-binding protein
MEAYFNQGKPGGEETLTAGLQAMFAGQKTPEQVAKELQDTVAKWYKPFQK